MASIPRLASSARKSPAMSSRASSCCRSVASRWASERPRANRCDCSAEQSSAIGRISRGSHANSPAGGMFRTVSCSVSAPSMKCM